MILERKPEPGPFLINVLVKVAQKHMLFDCISKAFFTKKTAKIAQEVWNLFQNVRKSFRKVRGRYEKRLETSGGVKMI